MIFITAPRPSANMKKWFSNLNKPKLNTKITGSFRIVKLADLYKYLLQIEERA